MLSNTKAITESWMIHLKAEEIKELEMPRRYIEDSTASKATKERARATLPQVRSGRSPPGVLSMSDLTPVRDNRSKGEVVSRVLVHHALRLRTMWEHTGSCVQRSRVWWDEVQKMAQAHMTYFQSHHVTSAYLLVPQTWDRDSLFCTANQQTR